MALEARATWPPKKREIFQQDETVTQPENSGRLVLFLFLFLFFFHATPFSTLFRSCHRCSTRIARRSRPVILADLSAGSYFCLNVPSLEQIKVTRLSHDILETGKSIGKLPGTFRNAATQGKALRALKRLSMQTTRLEIRLRTEGRIIPMQGIFNLRCDAASYVHDYHRDK